MHVHLLVPDLLAKMPPEATESLPAAELLLARGHRSEEKLQPERWLKEQFGLAGEDDSGLAPFSLLGEGIAPGDDAWLRADPVHLRVERDALSLADAAVFSISKAESEGLCACLDRQFTPQLGFIAPQPQRWYCRSQAPVRLACTPLAQARGRSVAAHLPQGEDAMHWHSFMNEAQMALHANAINEAREARGEPELNSIWFWGAGRLEKPGLRPFERVFADDPLARGLGLAAGASAHPLPAGAAGLLASGAESGRVLVMLDGLRAATAYADFESWQGQVQALERDWFAPLLAALRSDRIGMLTLHTTCPSSEGSGLAVEAAKGDLRRFWRRPRPLSHYRNVEA